MGCAAEQLLVSVVYLAARRSDGHRSEDQPGAGGRTRGSMGAEQTNGVREVGPGGQGGPGRAGLGLHLAASRLAATGDVSCQSRSVGQGGRRPRGVRGLGVCASVAVRRACRRVREPRDAALTLRHGARRGQEALAEAGRGADECQSCWSVTAARARALPCPAVMCTPCVLEVSRAPRRCEGRSEGAS